MVAHSPSTGIPSSRDENTPLFPSSVAEQTPQTYKRFLENFVLLKYETLTWLEKGRKRKKYFDQNKNQRDRSCQKDAEGKGNGKELTRISATPRPQFRIKVRSYPRRGSIEVILDPKPSRPVTGKTFTEVLRQIRSKVSPNKSGTKIRAFR